MNVLCYHEWGQTEEGLEASCKHNYIVDLVEQYRQHAIVSGTTVDDRYTPTEGWSFELKKFHFARTAGDYFIRFLKFTAKKRGLCLDCLVDPDVYGLKPEDVGLLEEEFLQENSHILFEEAENSKVLFELENLKREFTELKVESEQLERNSL